MAETKKGNHCGNKLQYVVLFTSHLKKSSEFYQKMFGFKSIGDPEQLEKSDWRSLEGSERGTTLGLHKADKHPSGTVHLCFSVPNINGFHEEVSKYPGVVVVEPPTKQDWICKAEYLAPDGIQFSTVEECENHEENAKKRKLEEQENRPKKLAYAVINTADMKKSIEFYTKMFGFHLKMESPGWSELEGNHGESLIGLNPFSKFPGTVHFSVEVPFIDKYHEEISKCPGVVVEEIPTKRHGIYLALYKTPDGATLSVLAQDTEKSNGTTTKKAGNGICH